ncbi:hypothetical protein ACWCXH_32615 [Kitasatospora sp. NPDC001660]
MPDRGVDGVAERSDLDGGRGAELYAASVSPARTLKLYPGSRHGADLLADGALPDVLAFLAQNVPVR